MCPQLLHQDHQDQDHQDHRQDHHQNQDRPTLERKEISSMFSPASDLGHGSSQICSLAQSETSSKYYEYRKCKLIGSAPPKSFTKAELQVELKLIALVTKARKADTKSPRGQQLSNPYKIRYSVYNMMLATATGPIKAALAAGVYVQILIEQSQTSPCLQSNSSICNASITVVIMKPFLN